MLTYLQSMISAFGVPAMNIPNRYTREMLIKRLDKGYEGLYDFVFMQEFHGAKTKHCLPGFGSAKIAEVSFARVQGREQNMENLRDEKFIEKLMDRPDWQPLFLDDSGQDKRECAPSGEKRRNSKKMATPPYIPPTTPTGFMRPPPYFPAPTFPAVGPPPAPPTILAAVLPGASKDTLLMLRGVPAKYTRQKFLDVLKSKYDSDFNFVFLPCNQSAEVCCSVGWKDFSGKQIKECFPEAEDSDKACEVNAARMESLEKSIERCQMQALENKTEDAALWLPILIGDDGEVEKLPTLSAAEGAVNVRKESGAGTAEVPEEPKSKGKPKDRKACSSSLFFLKSTELTAWRRAKMRLRLLRHLATHIHLAA
eukprot:g16284.t1